MVQQQFGLPGVVRSPTVKIGTALSKRNERHVLPIRRPARHTVVSSLSKREAGTWAVRELLDPYVGAEIRLDSERESILIGRESHSPVDITREKRPFRGDRRGLTSAVHPHDLVFNSRCRVPHRIERGTFPRELHFKWPHALDHSDRCASHLQRTEIEPGRQEPPASGDIHDVSCGYVPDARYLCN